MGAGRLSCDCRRRQPRGFKRTVHSIGQADQLALWNSSRPNRYGSRSIRFPQRQNGVLRGRFRGRFSAEPAFFEEAAGRLTEVYIREDDRSAKALIGTKRKLPLHDYPAFVRFLLWHSIRYGEPYGHCKIFIYNLHFLKKIAYSRVVVAWSAS